jgi:CDP-glucose 4,6-dehydratase
VEGVEVVNAIWKGRPVFLTGHTGFKGSWLSLWLSQLGARVHGYSLDPPTNPNMFEAARLEAHLASHLRADILDLERLRRAVRESSPEVVFHLAAQPIVRTSYADPIGTFATNVMGTAHVMEALRGVESVRAIVIITTDKVYDPRRSEFAYREDDPLGGNDPYSASKAAAEIVTASYRKSFYLSKDGRPARVATVRAGNVIGGGDWAADRIVPDCLRAFGAGDPVHLRYPQAIRPWQHVLEPLSGYLQLAETLLEKPQGGFDSSWNFGPRPEDDATVGHLADSIARLWGDGARVVHSPSDKNPHEDKLLKLDSTRAHSELGWHPRWSLEQALHHTVSWHRAWLSNEDMAQVSLRQIREYEAGAAR